MIAIKEVVTKKDLAAFIDFPHQLYQTDKQYVAELHIAQRDLLSKGKHPFHEHSSLQCFLATENGEIKGRIAAIFNNNHNQFKQKNDGFFGFYDVVNNQEVSTALINAATRWLKDKGANTLIGPVNPSTNEACGVLIEGFEWPPVAIMTYNKPYYAALLAHDGLQKQTDLIAYHLDTSTTDKRSLQLKEALLSRLSRQGISIRKINMKNFDAEVASVLAVYNSAWIENTGFVPMTEKEFRYLAKDLKMILDKDFCLLAEHQGKVIGFALAIPNINQVLKTIKNGRLFPFGIFKLLLGLKKINYLRVLALGVVDGYRKMGIEACFYADIIGTAMAKNIIGAEASWILENNELMKNGLLKLNASPYKRYRLYQKSI